MRRLLAAAALLLATPAAAQTALPDWLAGTWAMEDGAEWADTLWTDARGGAMLGLARRGFGPQMQGWQTLHLARAAGGTITLTVHHESGPPLAYPLVLASAAAVEFANPAARWPQRLRYARQGKLLTLELSRLDGSELQRLQFRAVVPPADD